MYKSVCVIICDQMGSMFKPSIFNQFQLNLISDWVGESGHSHRLQNQPQPHDEIIATIDEGIATSTTELSTPVLIPEQV